MCATASSISPPPRQVAETAAKHFAGQHDLLLVSVDSARLGDALKWEPSRGGALFPHLYGDACAGRRAQSRALAARRRRTPPFSAARPLSPRNPRPGERKLLSSPSRELPMHLQDLQLEHDPCLGFQRGARPAALGGRHAAPARRGALPLPGQRQLRAGDRRADACTSSPRARAHPLCRLRRAASGGRRRRQGGGRCRTRRQGVEHRPFRLNGCACPTFCRRMIFSENRFPLFGIMR